MDRGARQPIVLRYRDGRSDRGYFMGLGPGVLRVAIARGRDQELQAALPLSIIEAVHFVVDLNQAPLATLSQAAPRAPMPGKSVEVHCASWSLKGVRVHSEDLGFFLVPADPRSNSARVFFPEGSPQLVETSDLPSPPADDEEEDEFNDVKTGQLLESRDLGRPSSPSGALMDLDPFAGSLRGTSNPAPAPSHTGPLPTWASAGTGPLPPLPPLAAVMPPISEPLLPAEVEALIGFDAPRPHSAPPGGRALPFWANPWAPAAPRLSFEHSEPEMLLPFPSSRDLPTATALKGGGSVAEEDEFDIDIDSPVSGLDDGSFGFGSHDLIDTE